MHDRLAIVVSWPVVLAVLSGIASGAGNGVMGTSSSPHVAVRNIDLGAARWTEGFWADRFDLCRRVTLPTMRVVLDLPDNSANFNNLRIAAGVATGKFFGNDWSDGDCYTTPGTIAVSAR